MKHIDFLDFLEFKTIEKPLPCTCENCLEKIKKWEMERGKVKNIENFSFQKQEKYLLEKLGKRTFPFKMVLAFGFSFILILGFFAFTNIIRDKKTINFDLEYAKIMEVYQRPDLGDLEACSIIFELENNKEDL